MRVVSAVIIFLTTAMLGQAYSELSHEAIIDALWDVRLKAVLLTRFPNATAEQIKEAHSYAYGGSVIQDMGYYPHSNGYFSDLTHYARSGDFILALISDAHTLDEFAFALGALSHYAADNDGHRLGTNIGEGLIYPKLRRKYGQIVTYSDDPNAHLKTEYAFDVEQVAQANYASEAYHDFIGFNVPAPLLERAFRETYGFEMAEMFDNVDVAIGSYRYSLSTLIPLFTRVAWADHNSEIRHARQGITKRRFLYVMRRSSYEREWGKDYDRPSFLDRVLAFILKLLPPIGRLSLLKFRPLTPYVEQLFMHSFDQAAKDYQAQLIQADARALRLPNMNFDVGRITPPGDYKLQEETYAFWLDRLAQDGFNGVPYVVRNDILTYYKDPGAAISPQLRRQDRQKLLRELEAFKYAGVLGQKSSLSPN